jgi:hypothetical protein
MIATTNRTSTRSTSMLFSRQRQHIHFLDALGGRPDMLDFQKLPDDILTLPDVPQLLKVVEETVYTIAQKGSSRHSPSVVSGASGEPTLTSDERT